MGAAAAGSVTQQHQGRQQQGDEAAELLEQQAVHARMVILRVGMAEGEEAQSGERQNRLGRVERKDDGQRARLMALLLSRYAQESSEEELLHRD